ncbi:MAG TPA: tetratricopeptide repeat protein [Pirellulaceae bacterium]
MSRRLSHSALALTLSLVLCAVHPAWTQSLDELGELFGESEGEDAKADDGAPDDPAATDEESLDPFGTSESDPGAAPAQTPEEQQAQVEKFLRETKALMESGKYAEAISEYSKVLSQQPGAYNLEIERARCFVLLKEPDLALQSFQRAIDYGSTDTPFLATAYAERADVLLNQQRYEEALTDAEAALRENPADPKVLYVRGKALARIGQIAGAQGGADYVNRAVTSLSRSIEGNAEYAAAFAERALAYAALQEYDLAVKDIEKACELEPDNLNYIGRLGLLRGGRANYEKNRFDADMPQVIKDYRNAIQQFEVFLDKEKGKTREAYRDADRETITPALVYQQLAEAKIALGSELSGPAQQQLWREAVTHCDEALVFDERSAAALYQKGVALRMLGDFEGAIEAFSNSFELIPDQETLLRRGIAWFHLGESVRAREDFMQSLEGAATVDGRAKFWIGATYAQEARFWEAIRYYSEALKQNPEYKPAYNNRALAYLQVDEYRRAANDFEELVRRDRKDSVAVQRRDQAVHMADSYGQ